MYDMKMRKILSMLLVLALAVCLLSAAALAGEEPGGEAAAGTGDSAGAAVEAEDTEPAGPAEAEDSADDAPADAPDMAEGADAADTAGEANAAPLSEPTGEPSYEPDEPAPAGGLYVLMNIPYAAFYAAEGTAEVDAVTSATLNKPRTIGLAGGSYHVNSDGSDITGIIYPVYVPDPAMLESFNEITDESTVTIVVTNRGTETETTFEGADALFEAPSYSYYRLAEEPAIYKTMNADGSFGAVSAAPRTVEGVTGSVTYNARHADIEIALEGLEGIDGSTRVSAVVVVDDLGRIYGMRHVGNIWRGTELGWKDDEMDLYGRTITLLRYYTTDEVVEYPVSIALKQKAGAAVSVSFSSEDTLALSGLPGDIVSPLVSVSSVVGRGETPVVLAENVPFEGGGISLSEPAVTGTSYKVTVVSDNYADIAVTLEKAPALSIDEDGKLARAGGDVSALYARVALVLDMNGVSGLLVQQATINPDGTIVIPQFLMNGVTVTAVSVALVTSIEDVSSPTPAVAAAASLLL